MPLDKAQAFTGTGGRASLIMILLNHQDDADKVAAALRGPGVSVLTWSDLNKFFVETMGTAMSFYVILDVIVILIVAVIIVNTLLMSVFERVREMGILAALGMKGRQIRLMFLLEAATLGLVGHCRGHRHRRGGRGLSGDDGHSHRRQDGRRGGQQLCAERHDVRPL